MIPLDCQAGITKYHNSDMGNTHIILDNASYAADFYHDLFFQGTFCPKEEGMYRIIFEGSVYEKYESDRSYYSFNSIDHNSRISPYHYLRPKTCYPYYTKQAIDGMYNINGSLYFQYNNNPKLLITSDYSYSCRKLICFKGSHDPQCFKFQTYNLRFPYFKLSYFITFLAINK